MIDDLKKWVKKEKEKISSDERFHYKPAPVHINAPLALIQVSMQARYDVLCEIEEKLAGA